MVTIILAIILTVLALLMIGVIVFSFIIMATFSDKPKNWEYKKDSFIGEIVDKAVKESIQETFKKRITDSNKMKVMPIFKCENFYSESLIDVINENPKIIKNYGGLIKFMNIKFKKNSKEHKLKLSIKAKQRWQDPEYIKKMKKLKKNAPRKKNGQFKKVKK